jgi:SsrA-binding protein
MPVAKIILNNKKAGYEYNILSSYEAGIVLNGAEVKSLRDGKVSFNDSYIIARDNELFIQNLYIAAYEHSSNFKADTTRLRKILLHRTEINKLIGRSQKSGNTIIATKLYFNHKNLVKIEIALASGKKQHDKRQAIKEREWGRKKQTILKNSFK